MRSNFTKAKLQAPRTASSYMQNIRDCEKAIRQVLDGEYTNPESMIRHFENKIRHYEEKLYAIS